VSDAGIGGNEAAQPWEGDSAGSDARVGIEVQGCKMMCARSWKYCRACCCCCVCVCVCGYVCLLPCFPRSCSTLSIDARLHLSHTSTLFPVEAAGYILTGDVCLADVTVVEFLFLAWGRKTAKTFGAQSRRLSAEERKKRQR
jgi:hypothetical protein